MFRMGVIAHQSLRDKMISAMKEVASLELEFFPLWYEHESQYLELTQLLTHQVDVILYGGSVPYYLSKKADCIKIPSDFVSHDEMSLTKAFFDLQKMGVNLENISIDTISENTLRNVCDELQLPFEQFKLKPLTEEKIGEDYTKFHIDLYKSGQPTMALTSRSVVYEQLVRDGIPCYYSIATKTSVINSINQLYLTYQRIKYQGSRIAIGLIKVKSPTLARESIFDSRRNQIEIHQHLLNYAEYMKGGLTELKEGLYLFYTTYGALEKATNEFKKIPDLTAFKDLNVTINIGIGTGDTSSIAEEGARKALIKAEKSGDGSVFIILENKELLGPLGNYTSRIIVRTENARLLVAAKDCGISVLAMAKMFHLFKNERCTNFTAEQLSTELGLSQRSARRIMTNLHQKGFAEPIGEEISTSQGRPRRIYQINLASLDVVESQND